MGLKYKSIKSTGHFPGNSIIRVPVYNNKTLPVVEQKNAGKDKIQNEFFLRDSQNVNR